MKESIVTKQLIGKLDKMGIILKCARCNKALKLGEPIAVGRKVPHRQVNYRKRSNVKIPRYIYCTSCADKMIYDIDDKGIAEIKLIIKE